MYFALKTKPSHFIKLIAIVCLLFTSNPRECLAIDNPDAPDLVSEFEKRAHSFEDKISLNAGGASSQLAFLFNEYEKFLDVELNLAYNSYMKKLKEDEREKMKQAQRAWLVYKEKDFEFIEKSWNKVKHGSSFQLSKGNFRVTVLKNRIIQFLNFNKAY